MEQEQLITGVLLSMYLPDKGPTPVYWDLDEEGFSRRDRLSMAIKNVSLLMGDPDEVESLDVESVKYFGVLPFADIHANALSYFFFVVNPEAPKPMASVLSILFNESQRSFIFDNITLLRPIIVETAEKMAADLGRSLEVDFERFEEYGRDLRRRLWGVYENPLAPISPQRKIKMLLTGLDNSGKTSYLIAIERKYSQLLGVQVTKGADREMVEMLGAQIFQWDLGGQRKFRERYLARPETYLVDADLLFYFVDVTDPARFDEAERYFADILERLSLYEKKPPIVVCLNKVDPDIEALFTTRDAIERLKRRFSKLVGSGESCLKFFETSVFSFPSIMSSFSYGLSQLSPNRELMKLQLEWLAKAANLNAILLLTPSGLVLSGFHGKGGGIETATLERVFEVTAPQFTELFQKFQQFRNTRSGVVVYKMSPSTIVGFVRLEYAREFFLMFLMPSEENLEDLNRLLPEFKERIEDLLNAYIS
ncbi:MAG: ADP-ribosylation factor-like protein [Promethearchaeota archaeon]